VTSPYDRLLALARKEAGLIAAGRIDELEELNRERDALVATLPATPPAHARAALQEANRLVSLSASVLASAVERAGTELGRVGTNRRAAAAYRAAAAA
jgi:hypothetical protein